MLIGNLNLITINDIFSYANNTSEQNVLEIISTEVSPTFLFKINLDLINLTKDATIRVYYKLDDTNYRLRYGTGVAAGTINWHQSLLNGYDDPQVALLINDIVSHDLKITIQSSSAQGSTRDIPYSYNGGR